MTFSCTSVTFYADKLGSLLLIVYIPSDKRIILVYSNEFTIDVYILTIVVAIKMMKVKIIFHINNIIIIIFSIVAIIIIIIIIIVIVIIISIIIIIIIIITTTTTSVVIIITTVLS